MNQFRPILILCVRSGVIELESCNKYIFKMYSYVSSMTILMILEKRLFLSYMFTTNQHVIYFCVDIILFIYFAVYEESTSCHYLFIMV